MPCDNFNPRSHERSDGAPTEVVRLPEISIHAPTRGATVYFVPSVCLSANFNPRSHERSDIKVSSYNYLFRNFNPRSHERSDDEAEDAVSLITISIHAPTRGATHATASGRCAYMNFNPRSHERSDALLILCRQLWHISIHAPTRGATEPQAIYG